MSSRILVDEIEPKTASLVLPKMDVPVFRVTKNDSQSISATTYTTIQYDDVEFDSHSYFNSGTYLYQPLVAGYYQFNAGMRINSDTDSEIYDFNFSKNGGTSSDVIQRVSFNQYRYTSAEINGLFYMNGSTDTMQCTVYLGTGLSTRSNALEMFFCGHLVRAGSI